MNILLLSMSKLSVREGIIEESKCKWTDENNTEHEIEYYSQLEPITRMLIEAGEIPDEVIMLCTRESVEQVPFMLKDEEKIMSPCEFYQERINLQLKNEKEIHYITMPQRRTLNSTDLESKRQAIAEIAEYVLKKKKEAGDLNLWIDTQGGLRDISLLMNAVFSLLKTSDVVPKGIYSINFEGGKGTIQKQNVTYQIFDFVSGMNEFIEYGRADQLLTYYKSIKEEIPPVVQTMNDLSEAIMLCNTDEFDRQLIELRKQIRKADKSDPLFSVFIEQIKNDYKKILDENATSLDIVEWLVSKKLYQQTLTYIESKVPAEWEEKYIIHFESNKEIPEEVFPKYNTNPCPNELNYYIGMLLDVSKLDKAESKIRLISSVNEILKMRWMQIEKGSDATFDYPKKGSPYVITVSTNANNKKLLSKQILMYRIVKDERNKWNHMMNTKRMTRKELTTVINEFIQNGRRLYADIQA